MSDVITRINDAWRRANYNRGLVEPALVGIRDDIALEFGPHSSAYVTICNELGTFYRSGGQFEKGEEAFLAALDALEALLGRHDNYATCLDNLAELYRLQGRLDDCEEALLRAEGYFDDRRSIEYSACINYQGHLANARKDFARALELYKRALEVLHEIGDPADQVATAHGNIAGAHQDLGEFDEAMAHIDAAIAIYESGATLKGSHYVSLLNSKALIFSKRGDDVSARHTFDEMLESMQHVGISPVDASVAVFNAGKFYERTNDAHGMRDALSWTDRLYGKFRIHNHPNYERLSKASLAWRKALAQRPR